MPVSTLSLQSTSVAFGDVNVGTPSYQLVTLTSSGTAAVTVSAGSVSGTGYSISGVSFPLTLNSGATATLDIEFDPTTAGVCGRHSNADQQLVDGNDLHDQPDRHGRGYIL